MLRRLPRRLLYVESHRCQVSNFKSDPDPPNSKLSHISFMDPVYLTLKQIFQGRVFVYLFTNGKSPNVLHLGFFDSERTFGDLTNTVLLNKSRTKCAYVLLQRRLQVYNFRD